MKAAVLLVVALFALLAVNVTARHRLDAFRAGVKARDVRTDCYKIVINNKEKVCKGDDLLTAVRNIGINALKTAAKLSTKASTTFPGNLKRCNSLTKLVKLAVDVSDQNEVKKLTTKVEQKVQQKVQQKDQKEDQKEDEQEVHQKVEQKVDQKKEPPPTIAYYGEIKTAADFRAHAASKCGGVKSANGDASSVNFRYFAIGKYLYVRVCKKGEGNGYVALWGTTDNSDIDCCDAPYPTMWLKAKTTDSGTATVDAFKALATSGTNTNPYMGMAGAAVLIPEAARDYTVAVLNYMLMDLTKDAELILGGKCPSTAGTCNYHDKNAPRDGLHPMAFGGAKESFANGKKWPQGGPLTRWSAEGLAHEADLVVKWFTAKGLNQGTVSNCQGVDSNNCQAFVESVVKTVANI